MAPGRALDTGSGAPVESARVGAAPPIAAPERAVGVYPADRNSRRPQEEEMRTRACFRVTAVAALALGLGIAACASMARDSETMLQRAGFRRIPADTSQKMAHLRTLPDRKLVSRVHDGQKYYVYADPDYCKCMWVGNAQQYQAYQGLLKQQRAAEDAALAAEEAKEWEIESCCAPGK
jgi:hypothetical protein